MARAADYVPALRRRPHLAVLGIANAVVHYVVALVLLAVAGIMLWHAVNDLANSQQPFVSAATTALNGVLFTIIVLEVMRTVAAHQEHGGVQLRPFLVIGMITAVRSILAVGARLSLQGAQRDASAAVVSTVRCPSSRAASASYHRHRHGNTDLGTQQPRNGG